MRTDDRWNTALQDLEDGLVAIGPAARDFALPPAPAPFKPSSGPTSINLAIQPWWRVKYSSSKDWLIRNLSLSVAGLAKNALVPSFSFAVGQGQVAVVKQLTLIIQSPTTATDVFATLLKNGGPIPGFDSVPFDPATVATEILETNDLDIILEENTQLTATFTNNNVGAATVGIKAAGWFTPLTDINRLQGGVMY